MLGGNVLVLNRLWQAVHITTARCAVILLYSGRAKALDADYTSYDWDGWLARPNDPRDAGDDYGPSRVDRWTLKATKSRYELDWLGEGQYPWPYMSVRLFLHGMAAEQVWQGEQTIGREGDFFSIAPMQRVSIPAG